jgi:hypothetical protein
MACGLDEIEYRWGSFLVWEEEVEQWVFSALRALMFMSVSSKSWEVKEEVGNCLWSGFAVVTGVVVHVLDMCGVVS